MLLWYDSLGDARSRLAWRNPVAPIIEHTGKDVLGVLETLGHLGVIGLKGLIQGEGLSLSLLVDIGDEAAL